MRYRMNVNLEFENKEDLKRMSILVAAYENILIDIQDTYCCEDKIYNDISLLDSVKWQLADEVERVFGNERKES